jgi:hypothetical protein
MPFYENGLFGDGAALALALVIGFVFGWFLERGGLGSARKLAGQFYLRDMTVLKVMFSAIVTAMLGSFWLARLGWLDLSQVFVPATYVLPQIAGGLLFGVGFVVGGLCPGTSCVAAATGRKDGLAVMAGMCAGILLFGLAFPLLETFYVSTALGETTLPELLGVSRGTVVFAITLLAIGAFTLSSRIERHFARSSP